MDHGRDDVLRSWTQGGRRLKSVGADGRIGVAKSEADRERVESSGGCQT